MFCVEREREGERERERERGREGGRERERQAETNVCAVPRTLDFSNEIVSRPYRLRVPYEYRTVEHERNECREMSRIRA